MNIQHNEGRGDRFLRLIIAELLFLIGFFWVGGVWQSVMYFVAGVTLFTSLSGVCMLYKIFGIDTTKTPRKNITKKNLILSIVVVVVVALAGSYVSMFLTKKVFLEDYGTMNNHYKQTLFYTGQNNRDQAVNNYVQLAQSYEVFYKKYSVYHPYPISRDPLFKSDLDRVKKTIDSLHDKITTGDLPGIHKELETIRPVFQDILKRNGFSLLAINLVDFHDVMEKVLDAANSKDCSLTIATYAEADEKLKAVENLSNDDEIQGIRSNLDALLNLAQQGKSDALPGKAAELKSSFVKVYLKRG